MIFVGMAVGPTLGSVLRRATSNPLTVFYFSAACHALFSLVNWTIVPESLSPKRMARARRQQASALANVHGIRAISSRALGTLLNFARPLAVMLPIRNKGLRRGRKLGRFDWSLTLVGFSHMFSLMVMVCLRKYHLNPVIHNVDVCGANQGADPYIFQYAQATYNWTSEEVWAYLLLILGYRTDCAYQLGYMLSTVGIARAIYLTMILPRTSSQTLLHD